MDLLNKENKKAQKQSLQVFGILFGIVIFLALFYDLSETSSKGLLFIVAMLCCFLFAKNLHESAKSEIALNELNKVSQMSNDVYSEELYVQLYKNSPIPYLILDSEGYIKSANIAALRILDVGHKQVKGMNIFNRLQSDNSEHLDLLVEKYRNSVAVSDEMVKVERTDKREAWALLSLFGSRDTAGKNIGLMTLVDVTRQKRAEDAKSEFVSLASHQLRTPISGMKWSAELLLMDNPEQLTSRQRKYIDRLLVSVERMAVLIDDFLRVSRFELGTFQADYQEVSLTSLFEDIMVEQSERVLQKHLVVKTFYDEDINKMVTDANLMRMIVTNLYANAVKYTRENGTIRLGFSRKEDTILITVSDDGMGIPPEDKDNIFSKLFRASNAVRNVPDGTGLGLYIVREAVAVLKGKVTFTSAENMGTTFEVVLPLEFSISKSLDNKFASTEEIKSVDII